MGIVIVISMVLLKLLFGVGLFSLGISAECMAGHCLEESSKPEVKGDAVVFYGCGWTVGLIGGVILLIAGLYLFIFAFMI